MNKKFIVMAAIAAVFGMSFTACSNNDDDLGGASNAPKGDTRSVIGFNTSLDNKTVTRGLAANVADIQVDGFSVWALDNREAGKFFMGAAGTASSNAGIACSWDGTNSLYNPATAYYWPQYDLSFIAMTPQTGGGIDGITIANATESATDVYANPTGTLYLTIPTTLASQKDIMFAAANAKDANDETDLDGNSALNDKDALQLTFKHALSQIVFKGKLEAGSTITKAVVHNIDLCKIANTGSIAISTGSDVASFVSTPDGSAAKVTNSANIITSGQVNSVDLASGFAVTYKDASGTDYDDITGGDITDALAHNASTTRKQQLMVLPQTVNTGLSAQTSTLSGTGITDGTDAYLRVNIDLFANGDETNYVLRNTDVFIKLNETTWAPGTKYTYVLEFSDDLLNPIQFTSVITDWADAQKDVKF
jgi:hypothetical protein